jgi:RNA polymerase sigma-70 factor (ECF subfamily)
MPQYRSSPSLDSASVADQARWFTEQVAPHESSLRSYLHGSFPAVRDVDDVVQESYLRIWKARMARPILSTKSFLFHVARHLAIDLMRRERVSPINLTIALHRLAVADQQADAAETACTQDEMELLAGALHALPPRCREIMMLRQIEGMSQKDIAAQLGLSVLTVQTQVVTGLRRIEHYFHERGLKTRKS